MAILFSQLTLNWMNSHIHLFQTYTDTYTDAASWVCFLLEILQTSTKKKLIYSFELTTSIRLALFCFNVNMITVNKYSFFEGEIQSLLVFDSSGIGTTIGATVVIFTGGIPFNIFDFLPFWHGRRSHSLFG